MENKSDKSSLLSYPIYFYLHKRSCIVEEVKQTDTYCMKERMKFDSMKRTLDTICRDFKKIRIGNYFYIDKTNSIREWWESKDEVTQVIRPDGFGKTLTINMVEKFFSVEYSGRSDLFEGLSIWNHEKYRSLQGNYPVILLSFADIKEISFAQTRKKYVKSLKIFTISMISCWEVIC